MFLSPRRLRMAPSALAIVAAALLFAPSAQADPVNPDGCNSNSLSQPFIGWHDFSWYELAPGGTFSDSSWSLTDGAQIVSGAEPFDAAGTPSSDSLSLPAGSSATSPATCVARDDRDLRYFVGGTGSVAVSVVYNGVAIQTGVATATDSWAPSPRALLAPALASVMTDGTVQVSLRFTGLAGDPRVSDVFIDPWRSHG